jgi:hypothetical protein
MDWLEGFDPVVSKLSFVAGTAVMELPSVREERSGVTWDQICCFKR